MAMRAPNGTPENPNPEGLIPIRLLPNLGGGFGYGITRSKDLPEGYERTINMLCHEGQLITPAFALTRIATQDASEGIGFLVPWNESDGTPTAIMGFNTAGAGAVGLIKNAALASETDATADKYGNAAHWDDGAGSARIIAGTKSGSKFLQSRTQAGTWAAGTNVGIKVVRAGDRFFATVNDYQIKTWAAGTNPLTASASATYQVGTSEAIITSLGAIGSSPVLGKENGIWAFEDDRFVEKYRVDHHPDNFPFMVPDGEGGLFTATAFGEIIHITQYGAIIAIDPLRDKTPGRDTPRGPIRHIAVKGDKIYALMGSAYRKVQPSGLKVLKTTDGGASYTDYSTNAKDQKRSTTVDLSLLDTAANGDWAIVGFDEKFLAVDWLMTAFDSNLAAFALHLSTGEGTWGSVADGFDGTSIQSLSSYTFQQSGQMGLGPSESLSSWVKATYNSLTKYWMRVSVTQLLDASVTAGEVSIIPARAAPAFSVTNNDQAEMFEAAGMLAKILVGRIRGDGIVWDDVYTLPEVSPAEQVVVTGLPTINSQSASLLTAFRRNTYQIALPSTEPHMTPYPALARDVANNLAPVFYPSAVDLGTGYHALRFIECRGRNFTIGTDKWKAAFRWDDTNAWATLDDLAQDYAVFQVSGENKGSVLHTAFQILDGSADDPIGPTGHEIIAWVKPLDDMPGSVAQPARTTPEAA